MTLHERLLRRAAIRDERAKDEQEQLDAATRELAVDGLTYEERTMLLARVKVLELDINASREGARVYREGAELIAEAR